MVCKKCGAEVEGSRCKPCRAEYCKAWKLANPEKAQASARAGRIRYQENNRDKVRAESRKWYHANKESLNEKNRIYRAENRDEINAKRRERYHADPETAREKLRQAYAKLSPEQKFQRILWGHEWRVNNRDKKSALGKRRYASEPKEKIDRDHIRQLFALQGGKCFDCSQEKQLTIGHLKPVVKGGTNDIRNIALQCRSCNSKQKDKIHPYVEVFYPSWL